MKALSKLAFAAAFALAAATQVHAAPLTLGDSVEVSNQSGGTTVLYQSVTFTLNGNSQTANAGLFELDHRPAGGGGAWTQFLSFCLEPDVNLQPFNNPYSVTSLAGGAYGAVSSLISELWGRHSAAAMATATGAAAFQMALWELAYEGTKDLTSGALSMGASAVRTLAQQWLDSLDGTGPMADDLVVLVDSGNGANRQDLLTIGVYPPNQVPEPGVLALVGIALAGTVMVRRRQQQQPRKS